MMAMRPMEVVMVQPERGLFVADLSEHAITIYAIPIFADLSEHAITIYAIPIFADLSEHADSKRRGVRRRCEGLTTSCRELCGDARRRVPALGIRRRHVPRGL